MVDEHDIGKKVVVRSDDSFYEFINNWECTLIGFESGFAKIEKPSDEFPGTTLLFYVPHTELELL